MASRTLQTLPPEVRHQIWSYLVQPTTIYPCDCALKGQQCHSEREGTCCEGSSTYQHCDNRILRVSRQLFDEVQPLVQRAEQTRTFVLCNNLCLEKLFLSLNQTDWIWLKHLKVDLFVGWGSNNQDDWFLSQMHNWARRYIMGTLSKYDHGRKVEIRLAECSKEDAHGRRTLMVDIFLE
jgi:hypothetical protein